jgi:hypothetical protein
MAKQGLLNTALAHLEKGEWQAAHDIVQNDESLAACWAHGIVHVMEGDIDNARYWYRRAGRAFSGDTVQELSALKKSLKPD